MGASLSVDTNTTPPSESQAPCPLSTASPTSSGHAPNFRRRPSSISQFTDTVGVVVAHSTHPNGPVLLISKPNHQSPTSRPPCSSEIHTAVNFLKTQPAATQSAHLTAHGPAVAVVDASCPVRSQAAPVCVHLRPSYRRTRSAPHCPVCSNSSVLPLPRKIPARSVSCHDSLLLRKEEETKHRRSYELKMASC
ncbi:hypothetical protein M0R45_005435 [Rubus argutus]|uniref:Uncharacterized protein n=1 Tax=Rubus argutus TaxID=59490 RepID=A0AAW1YMP1_RUBAR